MARTVSKTLHLLILAIVANLVLAPAISAAQSPDAQSPAAQEGGFDLDLDEINRIIDQSDDTGPPRDEMGRSYTLEEAIKVALEHNLQLQIAALDVEAQLPEISSSKAKFHPLAGFNLGADGAESTSIDSGVTSGIQNNLSGDASVTQAIPTGGTLALSADLNRLSDPSEPDWKHDAGLTISVTQPLLKGGRTYVSRREILDSGYDHEILKARLHAEILNVTAATKIAYYNTILTESLIGVTASALLRDKELIDASRALFDAGRVNKRDVFSAEIKLAEDRARLAKDEANSESAQNALRDILGMPIDLVVGVTETRVRFEPVTIEIGEWIRSAINNRPELLQIRTELEKQDLDIKVRRNSVLPNLDFVGSYRRSQEGSNLGRALELDAHSWTAGLKFEIPFGNVAARSQLAAARTSRARIERQ